jgi:hypothetical protein
MLRSRRPAFTGGQDRKEETMTARRMKTLLLVLCTAALLWLPAAAGAKTAYYRCQVLIAGPTSDSQTGIMLRGVSPAFSDRWFLADPLRAKEQLAVALAAMLNGKEVFVQVDLDQPGKPEIFAILLIN